MCFGIQFTLRLRVFLSAVYCCSLSHFFCFICFSNLFLTRNICKQKKNELDIQKQKFKILNNDTLGNMKKKWVWFALGNQVSLSLFSLFSLFSIRMSILLLYSDMYIPKTININMGKYAYFYQIDVCKLRIFDLKTKRMKIKRLFVTEHSISAKCICKLTAIIVKIVIMKSSSNKSTWNNFHRSYKLKDKSKCLSIFCLNCHVSPQQLQMLAKFHSQPKCISYWGLGFCCSHFIAHFYFFCFASDVCVCVCCAEFVFLLFVSHLFFTSKIHNNNKYTEWNSKNLYWYWHQSNMVNSIYSFINVSYRSYSNLSTHIICIVYLTHMFSSIYYNNNIYVYWIKFIV